MESNTKKQNVRKRIDELKDQQLNDAFATGDLIQDEFSDFLKEQLKKESDKMSKPNITLEDLETGAVNFTPAVQFPIGATFHEMIRNSDPEQMELLKSRAELINKLRSGEKREQMVPLAIPEEVKKIKDFPTTRSLKRESIKANAEELDLISFGTSVKDKTAEKEEEFTVTLRVPKSVHDKLTKMVIQRSSDTGEILNKSSYLRLLIEKDFKERTRIQF